MKSLLFGYALLGYLAALGTLTFLIIWIFPWSFLPCTIDSVCIDLTYNPWIIDTMLILFFGLQHSLMARQSIKQFLFKERSEAFKAATYSLVSSLALIAFFLWWQPIELYVWKLEDGIFWWTMTLLYIFGWSFAFIATFMIDHFELFGLHQAYRYLKDIPESETPFQKRGFYRYIRHPIQAGTLLGIWANPSMSMGHLLFSIGMTLYVLIGLWYEEKALVDRFGDAYKDYQREVPMLVPFLAKS